MKALTLYQPWATLIIHGPKRIENRRWTPPKDLIGKRIAIHAGKTIDGGAVIRHEDTLLKATGGVFEIPTGVVLGTAIVYGYVTRSDDEWFSGPIGWQLAEVRALPEPIPCRGAQGLWDLPPDVEAQLPFFKSVL